MSKSWVNTAVKGIAKPKPPTITDIVKTLLGDGKARSLKSIIAETQASSSGIKRALRMLSQSGDIAKPRRGIYQRVA